MAHPLANATYRELLLWLVRRRKRLRVFGESMLPSLQPGEEILFDPHAYRRSPPQVGDIIVALHPLEKNLTIVKRIEQIDRGVGKPGSEAYRYFIVGDNPPSSTDSRHWGKIKRANIIGRVTSKFN